MPNPTPRQVQQPWGMKHVRMGGSTLASPQDIVLIADVLDRDYYCYKDSFDKLTIANDAFWTAVNTGAGSAAPVVAVVATRGMAAQFVTGGGNPGVSALHGTNAAHSSDNNPFMYARIALPAAVTAFAFEIGFGNVWSTKTTAAVSALGADASGVTAPTVGNGLTDGVVLCMSTAYTLTTPALVGIGTSIATTGTTIKNSAGTAYAPTAAKILDIYLGSRVGSGYCEIYENDVFIGQFSVASGPDTAKMLFPMFQFRDLGTSKVVNMLQFKMISERNDR